MRAIRHRTAVGKHNTSWPMCTWLQWKTLTEHWITGSTRFRWGVLLCSWGIDANTTVGNIPNPNIHLSYTTVCDQLVCVEVSKANTIIYLMNQRALNGNMLSLRCHIFFFPYAAPSKLKYSHYRRIRPRTHTHTVFIHVHHIDTVHCLQLMLCCCIFLSSFSISHCHQKNKNQRRAAQSHLTTKKSNRGEGESSKIEQSVCICHTVVRGCSDACDSKPPSQLDKSSIISKLFRLLPCKACKLTHFKVRAGCALTTNFPTFHHHISIIMQGY